MAQELPELPSEAFSKRDRSPDPLFYAQPRLVTHIDAAAIAAVTDLYRAVIPSGCVVLDLMSSWISHLPDEIAYESVIGHGLNATELTANPRLARHFVQDLNAQPHLPLDTASVDAALICVSVQYLQRPVEVLSELVRVLRPGAPVVISFSNRCFPTKAVAIWGALDGTGHAELVRLYLQSAGFASVDTHVLKPEGASGDPLTAVVGWTASG
ncbi:methyltransferase domain-containing protein [Methylobacterium pseudosasicola]|uniref:Methyltransferase domain-containing protein n=1 Tax=Methylobacterium pseudosasicola TaxID=582667 RepID=A0A1I4KU56_9HYPH|nr:methyltransferase domain-containing protein [Methylobacterium pseudosasicola]SFL82278.1 Methyltransferase domain-containing protein [Methylobacterium pseudosasicola]